MGDNRVGLEINRKHSVWRHQQSVDNAVHAGIAQICGDGHLCKCVRREHLLAIRRAEDPLCLRQQSLPFIMLRDMFGATVPICLRQIRQMFEQEVQRRAAGLGLLFAEAAVTGQGLGPAQIFGRAQGCCGRHIGGGCVAKDVWQRDLFFFGQIGRYKRRGIPVPMRPPQAVSAGGVKGQGAHGFQGRFYPLIPAVSALIEITGPGHDQPFFRPGQSDIEQSQPFVGLFLLRKRAGGIHGRWHLVTAHTPKRRAFDLHHLWRRRGAALCGVGQDHDRGLQPLGAMHRHHPDHRTGSPHLALDLQIIGLHPDKEPGQAWHLRAFIGQGLRQQLVDAILSLGAKTPQQFCTAQMAGQDTFDQIIRAQEIRLTAKIIEDRHGLGECLRSRT